eukprot:TRINITY_DN66700_c10_g4_i1.p1 TRINITY_DN66700_c10_g4~~TRINITY_DN66700_c10_g4_i1.p1  ORF type:complete len:255 (+),score=26.64 TRINITY_DN66700_c10_g4_i1:36-800(+)
MLEVIVLLVSVVSLFCNDIHPSKHTFIPQWIRTLTFLPKGSLTEYPTTDTLMITGSSPEIQFYAVDDLNTALIRIPLHATTYERAEDTTVKFLPHLKAAVFAIPWADPSVFLLDLDTLSVISPDNHLASTNCGHKRPSAITYTTIVQSEMDPNLLYLHDGNGNVAKLQVDVAHAAITRQVCDLPELDSDGLMVVDEQRDLMYLTSGVQLHAVNLTTLRLISSRELLFTCDPNSKSVLVQTVTIPEADKHWDRLR